MNTRSHLVLLFHSLSIVPPTRMQHVFPSQAAGSIGYTFGDPTNPCCLQNPGFVEIGDEKTVVVREGPRWKPTKKKLRSFPPHPENSYHFCNNLVLFFFKFRVYIASVKRPFPNHPVQPVNLVWQMPPWKCCRKGLSIIYLFRNGVQISPTFQNGTFEEVHDFPNFQKLR